MSGDDDDDAAAPSEPTEQPDPRRVVDAGSRKGLKRAEREALKRKEKSDEFWRGVMSTDVGRREMWNLIAVQGHAFETPFAVGPNGFPQPDATMWRAAEQAFGLRLYQSLLMLAPEETHLMHRECDPRFVKPET